MARMLKVLIKERSYIFMIIKIVSRTSIQFIGYCSRDLFCLFLRPIILVLIIN